MPSFKITVGVDQIVHTLINSTFHQQQVSGNSIHQN